MNAINPTNIQFEPGTPATEGNFIPLCVPEIRGNEWQYVKECLDTNWVSSVGSYVDRFEEMVAEYLGVKYAVGVVNGTSALHIALLVAGVEADDEVIVPTLTFISPVNAIRYVGAWPIFMDSEPDYWQMDCNKLADFLEKECRWHQGKLYNKTSDRQIKAILPVNILGHPVDLDAILEVACKYNLVVIEDAAEGLGAKYKGRMVGNLGDIGCLSFNGNKIITTGGGGMIVTDNEAWAKKAKYLTTQAKDNPIEYIHNEIGYNYRLTNIQGAMGCAQMEQLNDYVATKRRIASLYDEAFRDIPGITTMAEAPWAFSTFWMYTILVDEKQYGRGSRTLLKDLSDRKIQTRPLWQPIHLSKPHAASQAYHVEVAPRLYQTSISLPCSVGLRENQQDLVISQIVH